VVASLVRRWIDGQTFAPRAGESGVHVVDASSAVLGSFEHVQLAGVMDGEWPERLPAEHLLFGERPAELGWPAETDRLDGERAAFADLLRLPASRLAVSVFTLEADALVKPIVRSSTKWSTQASRRSPTDRPDTRSSTTRRSPGNRSITRRSARARASGCARRMTRLVDTAIAITATPIRIRRRRIR
jgi:hypothetical protein